MAELTGSVVDVMVVVTTVDADVVVESVTDVVIVILDAFAELLVKMHVTLVVVVTESSVLRYLFVHWRTDLANLGAMVVLEHVIDVEVVVVTEYRTCEV